MAVLQWDVNATDRKYSTGVDHVTLRDPSITTSSATKAWAWNGVTTINDNSTGGDSNKVYADNISYLNLISDEQYGATLECYQKPDKFDEFDGKSEPTWSEGSIFASIGNAIMATAQPRKPFGLSYRTWFGDDATSAGTNPKNCSYHFVYNCKASPAARDHATVNETPEAATNSIELTTTKQTFSGVTGFSDVIKTAHIEIDCRKLSDEKFAALESWVNNDANSMPTVTQLNLWAAAS